MIPGMDDNALVEMTDSLWQKTRTFKELKERLERIERLLNDMLSIDDQTDGK